MILKLPPGSPTSPLLHAHGLDCFKHLFEEQHCLAMSPATGSLLALPQGPQVTKQWYLILIQATTPRLRASLGSGLAALARRVARDEHRPCRHWSARSLARRPWALEQRV